MIPKGARWHVVALVVEFGLIGVIATFLLAISFAHNVTFDLTPQKEHTLSDQAQRAARRLDRDVVDLRIANQIKVVTAVHDAVIAYPAVVRKANIGNHSPGLP